MKFTKVMKGKDSLGRSLFVLIFLFNPKNRNGTTDLQDLHR